MYNQDKLPYESPTCGSTVPGFLHCERGLPSFFYWALWGIFGHSASLWFRGTTVLFLPLLQILKGTANDCWIAARRRRPDVGQIWRYILLFFFEWWLWGRSCKKAVGEETKLTGGEYSWLSIIKVYAWDRKGIFHREIVHTTEIVILN